MTSARFRRFSWLAVASVVAVILWGAYVRASGSGAGCGSHWPTCNGDLVPRSPRAETIIELVHRLTSGAAGIAVLVQLLWSRRLFPAGHRVRRAAAWSGAFMIGEIAVGAGIVLLRYVGDDASVGRALWMALHLCNTFLLLGAMTLTAHFAGGAEGARLSGHGPRAAAAIAVVAGMIFVGMTGSIAALGDTLYPARDLGAGLAADLSPAAHFLVRLRAIHPLAAIAVAFAVLGARLFLTGRQPTAAVVRAGRLLRLAIAAQLCFGLLNLVLLAPTWMQIGHLFLADVVWMTLVIFLASALAESPAAAVAAAPLPERS